MKRKSGHKKGKSKSKKLKQMVPDEASPNSASADVDGGDGDMDELNITESESRVEDEKPASAGTIHVEKYLENKTPEVRAEIPTSSVTDRLDKIFNNNPDVPLQKPVAVYGRVRLKLKNAKASLESRATPSDAPAQNDDGKENQQMDLDKKGPIAGKMEDSSSTISLPETEVAAAENVPKKAGSIKIKSFKGLPSSCTAQTTNSGTSVDEKSPEEPKKHLQYNKEELVASLKVIKKVMKMDAAVPFNAPVDPIELGIPDYFDVINTPMDFSTICNNLEKGSKYMNSEDVYRDVQLIWENCYKYNNKGDYVVELMKRVKKNFAKYWSAAGLYSGHSKRNGVEGLNAEDGGPSSYEKKPKKGFKRHKEGCLCAICIMMRRRQEREAHEAREARAVRGQDAHARPTSDSNLAGESKQEETVLVESPLGGDTSSYMETSPDIDAEAEGEDNLGDIRLEGGEPQIDGQEEMDEEVNEELHDSGDRLGDISEKLQRGSNAENESNPDSESKLVDAYADKMRSDAQQQLPLNLDEQTLLYQQKKLELLELEKKRQKSKLFEKFRGLESSMLLELSSTLFTADPNSLWSGPHSLVCRHKSSRNSDIHKAIASFMN